MTIIKSRSISGNGRTWQIVTVIVMILALPIWLAGCGDRVRMPTPEQKAAFEAGGSIAPTVDMDRISKAKLHTGPYRVVPGDVLEFTMPGLLRAVTAAGVREAQAQNGGAHPYICRVSEQRTITLPAVGELEVSGKSLAEVEADVIDAYKPHVVRRPSVYVRVLEYRTSKAYITGAVEKPGVYTLRADQMTLVSLLTEAGGISEAGAAVVRIVRSDDQERADERAALSYPTQTTLASAGASAPDETPSPASNGKRRAIVLPVVGMNIPFRDVALEEGDTVVVEPIHMPLMSVLGLVQRPGNFPYPPQAQYNLTQAIAFAGGLDMTADPRYATVYRLKPDGTVLRAPFKLIDHGHFTEALSVPIRPGDVVAIEHTPRTRTNAFINRVFRINVGTYIRLDDIWND
ncbi:MAG: SLBB domain-containing protein [Phycisphaerales bacterium]|nr:MAG: SLBB domain-containing protein [Phycisphaerales bacterium]